MLESSLDLTGIWLSVKHGPHPVGERKCEAQAFPLGSTHLICATTEDHRRATRPPFRATVY